MRDSLPGRFLAVGGVLSLVAFASVPAAMARADAKKPDGWSNVEKASAAVAVTPGTEDLAPVLFPALLKMTPAPGPVADVDAAMLLSSKSPGWKAASDWAAAPEQQEALKALATVTDPKKKFLLAIPYGTQGLDAEWVKAGLCVELPPSGLLQGARYRYRPALNRLVMLVNIEATRKGIDGKVDQALSLCNQWLRLARIVAEREGVRERRWGMDNMILAAERMRDIVHTFREKATQEQLRYAADDLDERLIQVGRIRMPLLERLAAEQLAERVIVEKGQVDVAKFASTMARLSADDRPLNLFGQAAWYRELAAGHAGWFDTRDQINKVFGGWINRWNFENLHHELLQIPSDYAKMDKARFALVELTANELEGLEQLRLDVLTALAGTRVSLGAVGYERKNRVWPPNVSAVAPIYVRTLDPDPFGYDKRFKNLNPFFYKVPIRDDVRREREEPKPHEMTVGVGRGTAAPVDAQVDSMAKRFMGTLRTGQWSTIGPEDLDFEGMLQNIEGTKKRLLEKAAAVNLSDSDLSMTAEALKLNAEVGEITPDMLKSLVAGLKAGGGEGGQALDKMNNMMGVSIDEYFGMLAQIDNATNKPTAVQELKNNAKNGVKLTNEMVRKASVAGTEVLTNDTGLLTRYLEMMAKVMKAPLGAAIRRSAGMGDPSAAASTFAVTVTQKDFLLWSTGPDAVDNQAKSVGVGGSDILIWPPILTLRREHAGM